MDNTDRISAIRTLLKSPGWNNYLKPDLEKALLILEKDVLRNEELSEKDREAKRNEAKALRKLIHKPDRDLVHLSKQMKQDS
jgi:hypothetical protein